MDGANIRICQKLIRNAAISFYIRFLFVWGVFCFVVVAIFALNKFTVIPVMQYKTKYSLYIHILYMYRRAADIVLIDITPCNTGKNLFADMSRHQAFIASI